MNRYDQPRATAASGEGYDWSSYFEARRAQPPRDTLLRALAIFDAEPPLDDANPRVAVDLGCGTGTDSVELLRRGWRVHAVDSSAQAISELTTAAASLATNLTTALTRYEDAIWPPCHLLNASFSIPHIVPADFPALWRKITASILPGGRFAGQLFGPDNSWGPEYAALARIYHSRAEVLALLAPFTIEHLEEVNRPGKDALGNPKHWHVYHIVARKPLTSTVPPVR